MKIVNYKRDQDLIRAILALVIFILLAVWFTPVDSASAALKTGKASKSGFFLRP